jgi:RND family efflux transporter MFP subunit
MKKIMYFTIIVIFLVSCKHSQKTEEKLYGDNVYKIDTSNVKSMIMQGDLHYSGSVEASQTISLAFQTSGTVDKVYVEEGDRVVKGQLLATLDKSDMQNMYNVSNAKYLQAKDAYNRMKEVYEKGSLSEIKWVEMETGLRQAEATVNLAKDNLEKCYLRAPEDGYIGKRNIEPGMSAISIKSPIEIVKINPVYVKISVPENEISRIKKNLKAKIKVSALGDKMYEGTITNIGVVADQISRTYDVKITVNNSNLELKPGMVCDVMLDIIVNKEVLLVPYQAVTTDIENKPYVFSVDMQKKSVKKKNIHISNYYSHGIIVTSGLNKGEVVVVEGKEKLNDNSKISL